MYHIVENLRGKNFRVLVQNENFAEKTFVDSSGPIIMQVRLQNFEEKTFTDGSETAKNATVFSLESFPLYGI